MGLGASIYNKQEAIDRLEGDEELFADMASLFVADAENYYAALENALKSGDSKALCREAHTLKSLFATFSYEAGRELAEQLEHLAATESADGVSGLALQVLAAIRALSQALADDVK